MPLADLSKEEFAALALALRLAQENGEAPPPGAISRAELASWFGTSSYDIKNEELSAIEKLRHALNV